MHLVGCLGLDYVLLVAALPLRVPDRAVLFFDAFQNVGRVCARAAIRKNRVGESELGQCDFAAAKQCRRIWAKARTNSRRSTKLQKFVETRFCSEPDTGAVF